MEENMCQGEAIFYINNIHFGSKYLFGGIWQIKRAFQKSHVIFLKGQSNVVEKA